jgi:hypothetical protein
MSRIPEKDALASLKAAIANLENAKKKITASKLLKIRDTCEELIATIKLTREVIDREMFFIEDAHDRYAMDAIPAKEDEGDG